MNCGVLAGSCDTSLALKRKAQIAESPALKLAPAYWEDIFTLMIKAAALNNWLTWDEVLWIDRRKTNRICSYVYYDGFPEDISVDKIVRRIRAYIEVGI